MFHRPHHLFLFPFKSFIPPTTTTTTTTAPLPSNLLSLPLAQSEQGMECVEGALKSSFRPDTAAKRTQQQALLGDSNAVNGQSGVAAVDDFLVDELLDFSKDGFLEAEGEHEEDTKLRSFSVSVSPREQEHQAGKDEHSVPEGTNFAAIDDFGSVPCSELSVPADDLADLEWLSNFVEDSFSGYSLTCPAGKFPVKPSDYKSKPAGIPVPTKPCFRTPVQTKARSKRARTGCRIWSLGSPYLTDSSPSSSTSSTTTSSPYSRWLIYASPNQAAESYFSQAPVVKKQRKKLEAPGGSPQPRRCSHCGVQKTPQWRTGPFGAKTLCNACGVRYKSGRLLPEYRPACSPTFSSEIHSNNHRKVLEMRRKKDAEDGLLAPPVQSF